MVRARRAGAWSNRTVSEYKDRWIECTDSAIMVRGYYFPWGSKRIPYASFKSLDRFAMTGST